MILIIVIIVIIIISIMGINSSSSLSTALCGNHRRHRCRRRHRRHHDQRVHTVYRKIYHCNNTYNTLWNFTRVSCVTRRRRSPPGLVGMITVTGYWNAWALQCGSWSPSEKFVCFLWSFVYFCIHIWYTLCENMLKQPAIAHSPRYGLHEGVTSW